MTKPATQSVHAYYTFFQTFKENLLEKRLEITGELRAEFLRLI